MEIKSPCGKTIIYDDADHTLLSRYSWVIESDHVANLYYAVFNYKICRKKKQIRMHRLITGVKKGLVVDHINHNPLDNRRSNLRICTNQENVRNRKAMKNCTSKYLGVSLGSNKKYQANITTKGKKMHLGSFHSENDAAIAYDKAAALYHGEFANLNFKTQAPLEAEILTLKNK